MAKAKPKLEDPGQQGLFGKAGELYNYLELRITVLIEEMEALAKKIQTSQLVMKALEQEVEKIKSMKKGLESAAPEPKKEQV